MYKTVEYGVYILEKAWEYLKFSFLILGTLYSAYTIWIAVVPTMTYANIQKRIGFQKMIPKWGAVLIIVTLAFLLKLFLEVRFRYFNVYHLKNPDLTISIRCGDILRKGKGKSRTDGTILIGINDQLIIGWHDEDKDTLIQQIKTEMPEVVDALNKEMTKKMESQPFAKINVTNPKEEQDGKKNKFQLAIGDYFRVHSNNQQVFIFSVISSFKSGADGPVTNQEALSKAYMMLFRNENLGCRNNTLFVPLLGKNCGMSATHSSRDLMLIAAKNFIMSADEKIGVKNLVFVVRPKTFRTLPIAEIYNYFEVIENICPKCYLMGNGEQ